MKLPEVIDEIKLELTGYVLESDIDDATYKSIVVKAMRELQRYWDETTLITVPYAKCYDLTDLGDGAEGVSTVVKVYRTEGSGDATSANAYADPLYAQQWMMFSNGGTMYNLNDYIMNYASWITLSKIKNTLGTDMSFKEDTHNKKLYVYANSIPNRITIEYIPKLTSIEKIQSDYWIDILIKLSVALTKVVLGRIRTRFTPSGALWTQDGEKILDEGNNELKELRETLRTNSNLIFPID